MRIVMKRPHNFLIDETVFVHMQTLICVNEQEKRKDIDDKAEKEMADTG